jgi:hypothetical protein
MAKQVHRKKEVRRTRRPLVPIGVAAGLVVAVVVAWLAYEAAPGHPGETLPDLGNLHIPTETAPHDPYNSDPPTSGPHLPYIAPWGVHTRPIPRELQVHNLEDGGVLVQYNCECPELVTKLQGIVQKYDKQVILAPYPSMKTRIALTAWTRLDAFDEFDAGRITRFIEAYRGIDHHK